MAKRTFIKQYLYYGRNEQGVENTANTISFAQLTGENNVFSGKQIIQLGIQAYPGLKFYLNGARSIEDSGVIIGPTGIYTINIDGESLITSLRFDADSLDNSLILHGGIIIDIIYIEEVL